MGVFSSLKKQPEDFMESEEDPLIDLTDE